MVTTRKGTRSKSAAASKPVATPTHHELTVVLAEPHPPPKHLCVQFVAKLVEEFQNTIQDYCAKRVMPSDETMEYMMKDQRDVESLFKNYVDDTHDGCLEEAELDKVCATYKRCYELIYSNYLQQDPRWMRTHPRAFEPSLTTVPYTNVPHIDVWDVGSRALTVVATETTAKKKTPPPPHVESPASKNSSASTKKRKRQNPLLLLTSPPHRYPTRSHHLLQLQQLVSLYKLFTSFHNIIY